MGLSKDKIVSNTKKFFETATKNGFMNDELMTFLGEEFIKAPASQLLSYNNAFEGGLIDHLLRVASYAIKINSTLPTSEQVSEASLLKVCLLSGLGKANLFTPCTSDWHRRNQGKMYEFNEDLVSMRVSERSVYYILSHGIKLTEEEYIAILYSDKLDDKLAHYHNSILGELLKMGIVLAVKHEQKAQTKIETNG